MSYYAPQQCPRCRARLAPGAATCANCGFILTNPSGPAMYRPGGQSAPRSDDAWSGSGGVFNRQSGPQYQQPGAFGGFSGAGDVLTHYERSQVSQSFLDASTRYERPQSGPPTPSAAWNRPVGSQRPFSDYQGTPPSAAGYGSSPTSFQRPAAPSRDQGWSYEPTQRSAGFYQDDAEPYGRSQPYRGGSVPMYQPGGQRSSAMYQPGGQSWQYASAGLPTAYPDAQPAYDPFASSEAFGPPMLPPRKSRKPLLMVLALLVVLGAVGGGAAFWYLRSRPVITVTSKYLVGSTPAGAASTTLHVAGSQFAPHSAVSFLLDGQPEPGHQIFQSDGSGGLQGDLAVTTDWPIGQLKLAAKDASGNTTFQSKTIAVVTPGEANTPGPKGAPADDASFTLHLAVKSHDKDTGENSNGTYTLVVTGQPDPAGGTVCNPQYDTGKPQTEKGTATNGLRYTATYTVTCSGTYKGGKITYKQIWSDTKIIYANGVTCTVPQFVNAELDGSFTSATAASGTLSSDAPTVTCSNGGSGTIKGVEGTWKGSIAA